uniref:Synaptonemal complex protein 1 n=1 Tax=Angiostrongylus cantonensis TaxID=6313 RepID=A0A0K0D8R5_ANGCA
LKEMELEEAELVKRSESISSELEKISRDNAIVKQKTAENEEKISLAKQSLEEIKAEVLQNEEALRKLKEQGEIQGQQMAAGLENMRNEFKQKCDILLKERDQYPKATEEARAEIEKFVQYEKYGAVHDDKCRKISEMQEKLSELKEYHSNLLKKIEEKKRERAEQVQIVCLKHRQKSSFHL